MLVKTSQDATTVRILRRGIGIVGLALPVLLVVGCLAFGRSLPGSMSGTYYTEMRNVFVGGMCAIGVFLICYRCGQRDDKLSWLAGAFAIMVALFPTTPDRTTHDVSFRDKVIAGVHYGSASLLLVLLAVFCLLLFTQTDPTKPVTPQKLKRNRIYRICGYVIILSMALFAASLLLPDSTQKTLRPLFWCEWLGVWAFSTAWLVKGETVYRDSQTGPEPAREPAARPAEVLS